MMQLMRAVASGCERLRAVAGGCGGCERLRRLRRLRAIASHCERLVQAPKMFAYKTDEFSVFDQLSRTKRKKICQEETLINSASNILR